MRIAASVPAFARYPTRKAASKLPSMPSIIPSHFPWKPLIILAAGFSSSIRMFLIVTWASFTRPSVAPASIAPSMAAFTSLMRNFLNLSYGDLSAWMSSQLVTPIAPSTSADMKTFNS